MPIKISELPVASLPLNSSDLAAVVQGGITCKTELENITTNVVVGLTTTLAPGNPASVFNSGSLTHPILNFSIPQGADGTPATVAIGSVITLSPGSPATVANVGTPSAVVLNFGLPTGPQGIQGNTGADATVAVGTVTTGAPGTNVIITDSGTPGAAVFNFTIPRGAPGTGNMSSSGAITAGHVAVFVDGNTIQDGGPLGGAAALNVGTTGGTVAAGDDSRIVNAVPNTRSVLAGGLLTGGGALSADRTITLTASTVAQIITGTNTTTAPTPKGLADATVPASASVTGAVTPDFSATRILYWTLTGNITVAAPTGLGPAGTPFILRLIQGGSGSYTATFNAAYEFPAAQKPVVLSTAVGAKDEVVGYVADASTPKLSCALRKDIG